MQSILSLERGTHLPRPHIPNKTVSLLGFSNENISGVVSRCIANFETLREKLSSRDAFTLIRKILEHSRTFRFRVDVVCLHIDLRLFTAFMGNRELGLYENVCLILSLECLVLNQNIFIYVLY